MPTVQEEYLYLCSVPPEQRQGLAALWLCSVCRRRQRRALQLQGPGPDFVELRWDSVGLVVRPQAYHHAWRAIHPRNFLYLVRAV